MSREQSAAEALAEMLRRSIRSGEFAPGQRLPSTRELAQQFSASKATISQALDALRREGMIDHGARRRAVVRRRRSIGRRILALVYEAEHLGQHDMPNWFGQILHSADRALLESGYQSNRALLQGNADTSDRHFEKAIDELLSDDVSGVLLRGGSPQAARVVRLLDERDIPWISIKPVERRVLYNYVTVDYFDAMRTIGHLLARMNRTRVVFLAPGFTDVSIQILAGLQLGYMEAGGKYRDIEYLYTDTTPLRDYESAGFKTTHRYLATGKSIDTIVSTGDYLALGAMRACQASGLRIPEDVGVIGMTGLALSAYMQPPLSVVRQPMERVGQEAARILLECIQHDRRRVIGFECGTEIYLRESLKADASIIDQVNAMNTETVIERGNDDGFEGSVVNAMFDAE